MEETRANTGNMNVLLLGATGPSGKEIVKKALEKGHNVTVLVRDPSKLENSTEQMNVVKGDILDPDSFSNAFNNQDAVISSLGRGKSLKSNDLISKATDNILPIMKEKNIPRLIFISGFGVGETFKQASFIEKIIFRTLLRNIYADKQKAEQKIRQSELDWTLVYPVLLTNKPYTGKYKIGENFLMKGMPKLTRADLADFIVSQLTDPAYIRKSPIIMN